MRRLSYIDCPDLSSEGRSPKKSDGKFTILCVSGRFRPLEVQKITTSPLRLSYIDCPDLSSEGRSPKKK